MRHWNLQSLLGYIAMGPFDKKCPVCLSACLFMCVGMCGVEFLSVCVCVCMCLPACLPARLSRSFRESRSRFSVRGA